MSPGTQQIRTLNSPLNSVFNLFYHSLNVPLLNHLPNFPLTQFTQHPTLNLPLIHNHPLNQLLFKFSTHSVTHHSIIHSIYRFFIIYIKNYLPSQSTPSSGINSQLICCYKRFSTFQMICQN